MLSVRFVLKKTFWDAYDYLGILVIANILACLLSMPIITIPFVILALFYVTRKISKREEVGVRDFFSGVVGLNDQAIKFGIAIIFFMALPLVNIFLTSRYMGNALGAMLFSLSVIILVISLLVAIYFLPLLVAKNTFKESFLASLYFLKTNCLFTLGVFLQIFMLIFIFLVSGIGIILILGSLSSLLMNNAFLSVLAVHKDEQLIDYALYEERSLKEIFLFWQQEVK